MVLAPPEEHTSMRQDMPRGQARPKDTRRVLHGMKGSRLYSIWAEMKKRCLTPTHKEYHNYGGRGIRVCGPWLSFVPFKDWAFANGYSNGLSIERINNNGDYCPENCKWIPISEQARNTRRTIWVGEMTLKEAARKAGINYDTVRSRIKSGMSMEVALSRKVRESNGEE